MPILSCRQDADPASKRRVYAGNADFFKPQRKAETDREKQRKRRFLKHRDTEEQRK